MLDRSDVPPLRKYLGITLLSSLFALPAPLLAQDSLRLAAEDTARCVELRDADVRLACFDAAANRLVEVIGSNDQAAAKSGDLPIEPDAPIPVEPTPQAAAAPPSWSAPPPPRESDKADVPRRFETTIVRITSNNVGRHRFYTEDGAVWEQTQVVEVRQPEELPAVAEIRRRLTGNPTIKFDVSSRSYRVRRIE